MAHPFNHSMADAPDRAVAVLGDQQRAVMGDGDPDRASPDLAVIDDEAGDEILVFARRLAVLEADTNDLVAGPLRTVPRAMLRGEGVAAIVRRKIVSLVEGQSERGGVRLKQHIGDGHLVLEIGTFAGMPGIFMIADIEPRPAIKSLLADAGHIV